MYDLSLSRNPGEDHRWSIQLLLKPKYLGSGTHGLGLKGAYNQGHDVAHFLELRINVIIYLNQG